MSKSKLVVKSALRVVNVDDIGTDPSYQREVKGRHKKIILEFDKEAFGIPVLGEREDGTVWVVDGLQRLTALRKMGVKTVRAEVFASEGPEHEARVFTKINKNRIGLTSRELFHAALTAGDETAWAVQKVVEETGFVLRKGGGSNAHTSAEHASKCLTCHGTLMNIATSYGNKTDYNTLAVLRDTLSVVKQCWPDDPLRTKADVVDGIAVFLLRHEGKADLERLVPRLNTTTPAKLLYSAAQGVGNRGNNVADVIERLYRKKLIKSREKMSE